MIGYMYTSLNHSLPLTVCMALTFFLCRKSAPKVSHSSCTRLWWPQKAATRTAVQPSWGRACKTGLWHKPHRKLMCTYVYVCAHSVMSLWQDHWSITHQPTQTTGTCDQSAPPPHHTHARTHTHMQANLVNGLHIKSTGFHEVLHHWQLTKIGCMVQGCGSIIIGVIEVALHIGGKVLSNSKMAAHGTQEKGISSSLQWMIGQAHNRSQPVHTYTYTIYLCIYVHAWFTVDDSMHPYQAPCQGAYIIRTAIYTTYVRTLQIHNHMTISNIQIQHGHLILMTREIAGLPNFVLLYRRSTVESLYKGHSE